MYKNQFLKDGITLVERQRGVCVCILASENIIHTCYIINEFSTLLLKNTTAIHAFPHALS